MAAINCSRAFLTCSGFPWEIINRYPEAMIKPKATTPAMDKAILKTVVKRAEMLVGRPPSAVGHVPLALISPQVDKGRAG